MMIALRFGRDPAMTFEAILLFGGKSEERLVSVASAQNLAGQYEFSELIFQDKTEKIFRITKAELFAHQDVFRSEFVPKSAAVAESLQAAIPFFKNKTVFLGWHGAHGENGEVQKLLEAEQILFTGSGSGASKSAFEKNLAKAIILNAGIKVPVELKFKTSEMNSLRSRFEKFLKQHGKVVFKPIGSGSSYGLHIVANEVELESALAAIAQDVFEDYLLENFITGRELTVGVVQDGEELISLPASEIIVEEGHSFDYEGKYLGTAASEITPADLTPEDLEKVQRLALDAHIALGCYGYSRTDIILTGDGPVFLETNTLPGLSKPSFIPQQLLAADIPFRHFIAAQLQLAQLRYSD